MSAGIHRRHTERTERTGLDVVTLYCVRMICTHNYGIRSTFVFVFLCLEINSDAPLSRGHTQEVRNFISALEKLHYDLSRDERAREREKKKD